MRMWRVYHTSGWRVTTALCVVLIVVLALTLHRGGGGAPPLVNVDRAVPVVWIGGVPRSGTTLLRAMLDAHPGVRCGAETRVIPRILALHRQMRTSSSERARLAAAGVTADVLDSALAAYLITVVSRHGPPAARLCNKDPFSLRFVDELLRAFPASRFLLVVRDGRAVAHSLIARGVSVKAFDTSSYAAALIGWNRAAASMYSSCLQVGPMVCHVVWYERLVLQPRAVMRGVLAFLNLAWSETVLHHEAAIGSRIQLSPRELSTDQVRRPVNADALSKWVDHISSSVRRDMRHLAPMLEILGYDPDAYPPRYDTLPSVVDPPPLNLLHDIMKKAINASRNI